MSDVEVPDAEVDVEVPATPTADVAVGGIDIEVHRPVGTGTAVEVGIPGPAGRDSGASYRHEQGVPANPWVIQHNLGFRPNIDCYSSTGERMWGRISHVDDNTATVTWMGPLGGEANCS